MKLVLGSASPRRKQLLEEMGYEFEVVTPDIDEKAIRDADPRKLVLKLARAKADAVIKKLKEPSLVLTADQVIYFHGKIHEKPESKEEARIMLQGYGTHPIEEYTAVVVTNSASGKEHSATNVSKFAFKPLPNKVIEEWLKKRNPLDHAGGFAIQDEIILPYWTRIDGRRDSIMGLPKELTRRLLKQAGF